jgi:hypothetical protein
MTNDLMNAYQEELKEVMKTGAQVTVRNDGHHWIINLDQTRVDYWPSSERFQVTFRTQIRRGYKSMLQSLAGQKKKDPAKAEHPRGRECE